MAGTLQKCSVPADRNVMAEAIAEAVAEAVLLVRLYHFIGC